MGLLLNEVLQEHYTISEVIEFARFGRAQYTLLFEDSAAAR
jgi:hypothetical protein